jgi:hypothetical protein
MTNANEQTTARVLKPVEQCLPAGARLVAVLYGQGPNEYLAVVLCQLNDTPAKYVTWTANLEAGGVGSGHYFDARDRNEVDKSALLRASEDFIERTKRMLA